jgi:hypothetical protein
MKARVREPLNYSLCDIATPEESICTYLETVIRSDLSCADQVNYSVKKTWRAFHFAMCILKKRKH